MSDDPQDDSKPPSRMPPLKAPIVFPYPLKISIAPPGPMCP